MNEQPATGALYTKRTHAALRIIGKDVDPAEVSYIFGVQPTRARLVEVEAASVNLSFWSLSSEGHIDSSSLEEHIDWVLRQIELRLVKLEGYLNQVNAYADVFCFWESAVGHGGPTLSANLLGRLAGYNLHLTLDIYFRDEAHEEVLDPN